MSIIADLIRAGVDPDLVARVADEIAAARALGHQECAPQRTARQDRNARYYDRRASEKRLKASEQDVLDAPLSPKEKSPAPPKEITPIQSSLRSDTPEAETQKRKRGPAGDVREILATVLSPEVAAGVIEHRQKLRKPLTGLAADGLVKAFAKTGAPDAAARMMIERGWQGFEPAWFANERGSGQANGGAAARASPSKYEKTYNLGFGVDTASAANVRKLVELFIESGKWDLKSPKPGDPGCRVPDEFLPPQYQQKGLAEAG